MGKRILLYGATGYSGGLIAEEAVRRWGNDSALSGNQFVLASRDARQLRRVAERLKLPWRSFGLDERTSAVRDIDGFDVVINAAGPFAATGERLAKACIETGTHYVDINGEVDVYKRLDDLGRNARQRRVTLVCGAGQTATVSNVMLHKALEHLKQAGLEPATVRIAASRLAHVSRGSARTMMRSIREQVALVRGGYDDETKGWRLRLSHAPVGRLERTFDFTLAGDAPLEDGRDRFGRRIASAANLIDTLVAKRTAETLGVDLDAIESYLEMPNSLRIGYQLGALSAGVFALPWVRRLNQWQIDQLPEGPTPAERGASRHRVLLEIEDRCRELLIDWRIETPDPYEFTARSALAVANELASKGRNVDAGWQPPAAIIAGSVGGWSFEPQPRAGTLRQWPFDGCRFDPVRTAAFSPAGGAAMVEGMSS